MQEEFRIEFDFRQPAARTDRLRLRVACFFHQPCEVPFCESASKTLDGAHPRLALHRVAPRRESLRPLRRHFRPTVEALVLRVQTSGTAARKLQGLLPDADRTGAGLRPRCHGIPSGLRGHRHHGCPGPRSLTRERRPSGLRRLAARSVFRQRRSGFEPEFSGSARFCLLIPAAFRRLPGALSTGAPRLNR